MNLNIQRFWRKRSVTITDYDPTYKVVYLGNVLTAWAKGDGCVDKPLATIWKNYCQSTKADVHMKLTVCNSGLKAVTKEHGLTEYWANRITYCGTHPHYPKLFCWVYRHEGRRLKQELRCHAALCSKLDHSASVANQLQNKLSLALQEFKREKLCRQKARLSLANSMYDNPSLPRRKILLSTGTANYRPPLERSKSAPKLGAIEECLEEEEEKDANNLLRPRSKMVLDHEDVGQMLAPSNRAYRRFMRRVSIDTLIDEALEEEDDEMLLMEEEELELEEEEEDRLLVNREDSLGSSSSSERGSSTSSDSVSEGESSSSEKSLNDNPSDDDEVVVDLPGGRRPLSSIDENITTLLDEEDEVDNISDESGYSEERENSSRCKM